MADDMYIKENETSTEVLSPLADPVVEEIYKDEGVAGLAAESFISAVLAECGERFGTVIELTPQKRQTQLGNRCLAKKLKRYARKFPQRENKADQKRSQRGRF
jgi:hypothetical protein